VDERQLQDRLEELAGSARQAAVAPGPAAARRQGRRIRLAAQASLVVVVVAVFAGGASVASTLMQPRGTAGGPGDPAKPCAAPTVRPDSPQTHSVTGSARPSG
jgi:hypothetical protein